jgi:TldD protein
VPPETVPIVRKRDLLHAADDVARGSSPLVGQVIAGYSEGRQRVLIANSLGDFVHDDRTRVRFVATVIARRDGIIQTGYQTIGGSAGFEILDEKVVTEAAAKAAGKAVTMLDARPAPMGTMPVVLANGFGGTLFHEACGHGLEADAIAKGASIYADRMGDVVAAPIVNAYDDGALANGWGSAAFDDEGVPTRKTMVIEEGRLCGYLYDRLRARGVGVESTGNGRRQSFRHVPLPRMTTTCIAPGDATPEAIIAVTAHGFYAKSLAGGQVEPASGNFVFGVSEGYLIEKGKVTTPLRGATLVGNGIDILKQIDMIAADFDLKSGVCGKDGQSVPVGTGQATLPIRQMTVGGTG